MALILSAKDFDRLSSYINTELGIKMPETKVPMLTGRLHKRLQALGMSTFQQYCDFLFSPEGMAKESVHLISAVTTNKTDFFREPTHFSFLIENVIPEIQEKYCYSPLSPFRIWSAGCASGEEPYTMAMVLADYALANGYFPYEILATDISTRVLEIAQRAVYPLERVQPVPMMQKKKYILKGSDKRRSEVRMAPEIRSKVRFGRLNFMDNDFNLPFLMDVVFCRNVIIYFDKPTQEQLMWKFAQYLRKGGYLFLGHSESLHGYDIPFEQLAPNIYRHVRTCEDEEALGGP